MQQNAITMTRTRTLPTPQSRRWRSSAPFQERLKKVRELWAEDHALKQEVQELAVAGKRDEDAVALLVTKETPKWREVKSVLLEVTKEHKKIFAVNKDREMRGIQAKRKTAAGNRRRCRLPAFIVFALIIARSITGRLRKPWP